MKLYYGTTLWKHVMESYYGITLRNYPHEKNPGGPWGVPRAPWNSGTARARPWDSNDAPLLIYRYIKKKNKKYRYVYIYCLYMNVYRYDVHMHMHAFMYVCERYG